MANCPNKNLSEWKTLVDVQGEDMAHYLWDKYNGEVPSEYNISLDQKLVDGFLKDFGITVSEYKDLKTDIGLDAVAASDLLAKSIAYQKGESISGEVAYFAYAMLGKQNSKIRASLRYMVHRWDKYSERFKYHSDTIKSREGYIKDKTDWKVKIRDLVIADFLKENIEEYYKNPKEFKKVIDTRWVKGVDKRREEYTIWENFVKLIEDLLSKFSNKYAKLKAEQLSNLGTSIAEEVLNNNYEYFNYELADGQIQKYYDSTINSDSFAKDLVEFGQKTIGLILTGSLALRRAGQVFRTAYETLHDIDWVVPYSLTNTSENKDVLDDIKRYQSPMAYNGVFDKDVANLMTLPYVEKLSWFKQFKEKYPSLRVIKGFYGGEHTKLESYSVLAVIDGESYTEDGFHEETVQFYKKDPVTKKAYQVEEVKKVKHAKGDLIKGTGYAVDFFVRLDYNQEEHENYFKLWKEIMIAKLKMGRDKDFIDWKAFVPFTKSRDKFNFNYEAFRHINYKNSESNAFEETKNIEQKPIVAEEQVTDEDLKYEIKEEEPTKTPDLFLSFSRGLKYSQRQALDIYMNDIKDKSLSDYGKELVNRKLRRISQSIGDADWHIAVNYKGNLYVAGYNNARVTDPNYYSPLASGMFRNQDDVPASTSSPELLELMKKAADKMGISIQSLADYAKEAKLDTTGINGVADLFRGIVAVAEDKENTALSEEIVHIATAIIEQKDPRLVTEMISKIDRFKIYNQTLNAYKDLPAYQLPNGKPNIRKIKKEAVDRLIVEVIINNNQGDTSYPELMEEVNQSLIRRWWNAILDRIRGFYRKANINIFEQVGDIIVQGNTGGTVEDIDGEVYYQITDAQKTIQENIISTRETIFKRVTKETVDPLLLDSEEASNFYEKESPDGTFKVITKRVTDRVKTWYERRFKSKVFSEQEKKLNNLKRDYGIQGHYDLELIHARYYNSDGTKKSTPDKRPIKFNVPSQKMYDMLETYYVDLINSFPKGENGEETLVFSEVIVYDESNEEAGTIDFLAIEPSGKANILDWKFMNVSAEQNDIPWFKQGAFNIQLSTYGNILKNNYGVKEIGMNRAIPILMELQRKNPKNPKSDMHLTGLSIGSVDKTKITNLKLVPVSQQDESTGFENLDKVISNMNALLRQYEKEEAVEEIEKEFKIERLNTLRAAIRLAQGINNIAPLIDVIEVMKREGERIIDDYETTYKDRPASSTDSTNVELSDFADKMNSYLKFSEIFVNVDRDLSDLIYSDEMITGEETEEELDLIQDRKETLISLSKQTKSIYNSRANIKKITMSFADKHIGQRNLVTGLTLPEAVVKGLSSLFRGISELPLRSLRLLYKLVRSAQGKASQESLTEVEELMAIRKKIVDKVKDSKGYINKIYQKDDKNKLVNKLVHVYSKEFHDTVDELADAGGDINWLLTNIDVPAYNKEVAELLQKKIEKINKTDYPGDAETAREKYILEQKRYWDIERADFNGFNNYILKRHPLPKWFSKEYIEIKKDPDLLELYNFIVKINKKANEEGYIQNAVGSTFLPFIRKSMAEELVWDNTISPMKNFANSLALNVEDVGYGKINEITGEVENAIPKYYTYDFTQTESGVNDYSDVSEDIFKNMVLYIQHVNKYKYLTEVEGQIKLIKTIEQFKNHLSTSRTAGIILEGDTPKEEKGNEENTKMFDDFTKVLLYGQKYVLGESDTPLYINKLMSGIRSAINKVAGKEIYKPNEGTPTSLIKTIDAANRAFQLKTLGLELVSGAVNMFGANIQVATQAGNYFKSREFAKNESLITFQKFRNEDEKQMFAQLINIFMPMKDDPTYDLYNQAGLSVLTRGNLSDFLFIAMRKPEQLVEKSIFLSLLENTMIENGKIVSIPEFVRAKYKDRYDSGSKYKESKRKIDSEIEELKRTRSIDAIKKLENDKLVIPGLDLSNRDELQRLTSLTRNLAKNATGGLSDGDINKMSMSIWTKSMMVFKNWIPKLVDTRFGEFRKVSDDFSVIIDENGISQGDKYDVGRIRLLLYTLGKSIMEGRMNLMNIINMNDEGIKKLDEMYKDFADTYKKETGETLTLSREDFMDLIRVNLRNQIKELLILASLLGAALALGFMAPDDEDDDRATKNAHRYAQKVVDKFIGELSFFYNPLEIQNLVSGSMFPAIGLTSDFLKFTSHLSREVTGIDFDSDTTYDEARKKAMPSKYLFKMLPVTKSLLTYAAIISDDFAREYDITIQKNNTRR